MSWGLVRGKSSKKIPVPVTYHPCPSREGECVSVTSLDVKYCNTQSTVFLCNECFSKNCYCLYVCLRRIFRSYKCCSAISLPFTRLIIVVSDKYERIKDFAMACTASYKWKCLNYNIFRCIINHCSRMGHAKFTATDDTLALLWAYTLLMVQKYKSLL